jgi:hypothetical protein
VCKAVTSAVLDYFQVKGAYDTEASVVAVQCKRVHDGKTKSLDIRGGSTLGGRRKRASVEGSITKSMRVSGMEPMKLGKPQVGFCTGMV